MDTLASSKCEACTALTPKLSLANVAELSKQLAGWNVVGDTHMTKKWKFKDFVSSLAMVNTIGVIAEAEGHHPDISFGWGYLEVTLTTHAIHGLSRNDFIVAAKIDALPQ